MKTVTFKPHFALTFKSVISIRSALCKALLDENGDIFCFNLSEVTHCDSAGLALLIEARRLCKQHNKQFKITGVSPETQSLAEFCGIKSILEPV